MTRFFSTASAIALIAGLVACEPDKKQQRAHRFGYRAPVDPGTELIEPTEPSRPEPTEPAVGPETKPSPREAKPLPPPSPARKDYPYAKSVPGKPGFVISPYAPYSGYVDVKGIPAGQEVACPYTSTDKVKKIFLVPAE